MGKVEGMTVGRREIRRGGKAQGIYLYEWYVTNPACLLLSGNREELF